MAARYNNIRKREEWNEDRYTLKKENWSYIKT